MESYINNSEMRLDPSALSPHCTNGSSNSSMTLKGHTGAFLNPPYSLCIIGLLLMGAFVNNFINYIW